MCHDEHVSNRSFRHVVLVHGAWHGAWCWSALQSELDRRGVPSLAVDLPGHGASPLPLTDFYGDAEHVVGTLRTLSERGVHDPILVGHSYGGAVVTEAAHRFGRVSHLVYLAAFAPNEGESVIDVLRSLPRRDNALTTAVRPGNDGTSTIDPALAARAFYGSCDEATVTSAVARLSPQPDTTVAQPTLGDPRRAIASTYVVCERDEAVHPDHQRAMAERCRHVVTFDTDHSPFASMTGATADLLTRLAGEP